MTPPDKTDKPHTQAAFALEHGKRTTDRMVEDILNALAVKLHGESILVNGKHLKIQKLGSVLTDDEGETRFLFDVLKPDDTFDHIEFKIVKTGWGRSL